MLAINFVLFVERQKCISPLSGKNVAPNANKFEIDSYFHVHRVDNGLPVVVVVVFFLLRTKASSKGCGKNSKSIKSN